MQNLYKHPIRHTVLILEETETGICEFHRGSNFSGEELQKPAEDFLGLCWVLGHICLR